VAGNGLKDRHGDITTRQREQVEEHEARAQMDWTLMTEDCPELVLCRSFIEEYLPSF